MCQNGWRTAKTTADRGRIYPLLFLYQTDFSRKSSGKFAVLICKIAENNYQQIPEQIVKKQSEHTLYGLREPVNSLDYLLI